MLWYVIYLDKKFLTKINCKTDASVNQVGPAGNKILKIYHNKNHQVGGWEFGNIKYDIGVGKQVNEILSQRKDKLIEKLIHHDNSMKDLQQVEYTHEQRFQEQLTSMYHLPKCNPELSVHKLREMRRNIKKRLDLISPSKKAASKIGSGAPSPLASPHYKSARVEPTSCKSLQSPFSIDSDSIVQFTPTSNVEIQKHKRQQMQSAYIHRVYKPTQFITASNSLHNRKKYFHSLQRILQTQTTEPNSDL